jgi:alanine-glyoxylate transaminase / serine-glyoxylate transaminase / serine-pyruvate transaminase
MTFETLKLMIPGPVQPEDDVLDALGSPVRAHYGPEWVQINAETNAMLAKVFGTQGETFIFPGSGSAGLDACIGSSLSSGEKILIGLNGYFAERLAEIAACYNLDMVAVEAEWGQPLKPQDFADAIRRNPDVKAVAVVHLETSTAVLNPVPEIARIARQAGICMIVDAVSSLGGVPFHMCEWGVDLCASASQKCLGAPPGVSPVAVGDRGWEFIERNPNRGHGWYLNLLIWRKFAHEWAHFHPFPTTQATNNVVALKTSLENLLREGMENRFKRFERIAARFRNELDRIGYRLFTPPELSAPVLTAVWGPPGVPTSQIVTYLADKHGLKISGGFGAPMVDKIIRIGHMSPGIKEEDVDQVAAALEAFLFEKTQATDREPFGA